MLRYILIALAVVVAPARALAGQPAADWSHVDKLIVQFLKPQKGKARPSALSISIGGNGRLLFAKGYGMARRGEPATAETVYHIGSLTKQFTAAAMLKLIESGARAPLDGRPLGLDTSLSDVFDGIEQWTGREQQQPVTVRRLLTMTSNLPNFTRVPPAGADPWGAVEAPRLFAALKRQAPSGWPGTFEYSNTSYFILAQVIEASLRAGDDARTTMRDYVRDKLLQPADLKRTGFVGDYPLDTLVADANYLRRPAFAQPHWLDGCADMASSASDIFAWDKALMGGQHRFGCGLESDVLRHGARRPADLLRHGLVRPARRRMGRLFSLGLCARLYVVQRDREEGRRLVAVGDAADQQRRR
jgi:CubicO group peptidase (beta-lactamase class C family)